MLTFDLFRPTAQPLRVLALGAHSDDIEIGCGATLLRLLEEKKSAVEVSWVVFSASPERRLEAEASAGRFLRHARRRSVQVANFRDGFFPFVGAEIKEWFEDLKRRFQPDLIFTHRREDRHQDHRTISDLTWNTFRDHLILEYEIPKYDGDLGQPNFFVPISKAHCRKKLTWLRDGFPSQKPHRWFTDETFLGLMRLRGIECNSPSGYAEAFHCRKAVLRNAR